MADLKDKVVIVTGSSSGIGAAAAVEFAKHGAKVVITGRNEARVQETAVKCQDVGLEAENILTVTADVLKDEDLERLVKRTTDRFGKIDVLINNAGFGIPGNMMMGNVDDFATMFNVHVRSNYVLTKLAAPHLFETKGNIINVSSVTSIRPMPITMGYCVAKAAQDQMTKCLSLEFAPQGVRVNTISPGGTRTAAFEGAGLQNKELVDQYMLFLGSFHPLGRVAEPEEIGRVLAFLASDAASFISGANLPIDCALQHTFPLKYGPE